MQDIRVLHDRRRLNWLLLRAAERDARARMVEVDPALSPNERRVHARQLRDAARRADAAYCRGLRQHQHGSPRWYHRIVRRFRALFGRAPGPARSQAAPHCAAVPEDTQ